MLKNRCNNTGLGRNKPFLTGASAKALRREIDQQLDQQIDEWNKTVPFATHFEGAQVHEAYYQRHLIETAWRIRLLRVSESKALPEIAKRSPEAAQIWANYEREEMLHDELFIQDLERSGVNRETILATEPFLSTKLLTGFLSYLLDHESPLGVVAYSYLVEYVNVKLEPKKLKALMQSIGENNILGQIAHSHTDVNDDHPGEVWEALRFLIQDEHDIEALRCYLGEHQRILAMYFREVYAATVNGASAESLVA